MNDVQAGDPAPPRVTLSDVAAAAQVARSTASDALNQRGRMSDATRQRVHRAAQALGYLPNPAARRLRTGRSRLIGVAPRPYFEDPDTHAADIYYGLLLSACTRTASSRGYAVALLPTQALEVAADLPLAGMWVTDTGPDDPALEHAHTLGIPVSSDYRPDDLRSTLTVDADIPGAVSLINDHLLDNGARRVGLLSADPVNTGFAAAWEQHHARWCATRGIEVNVARGPSKAGSTLAAAASQLWESGCDAVVGLPLNSGPELLASARALGYRVPDDVLVACIDEDPDLANTDPPLTTVGLDPVRTAVEGTNTLIDVIEGKLRPPIHVFIPAQLTARTSTQRAGIVGD